MRPIKFRARRLSDGKWCTGDLVVGKDAAYIISGWPLEAEKLSMLMGTYSLRVEGQINVCDLKTVGQYTGLKDKNGVKIYEGDVLLYAAETKSAEVKWEIDRWSVNSIPLHFVAHDSEVIGNIYDNPELLDQAA